MERRENYTILNLICKHGYLYIQARGTNTTVPTAVHTLLAHPHTHQAKKTGVEREENGSQLARGDSV